MHEQNEYPASSGCSIPASVEDAAARMGELTANKGIPGLIGSLYYDIDQLTKALNECGWRTGVPLTLGVTGPSIVLSIEVIHGLLQYSIIVHHWDRCRVLTAQLAKKEHADTLAIPQPFKRS